jgi:CRISPR-associated protein Cas1
VIKRLIEVSSGPAHLSVKHHQLIVSRPDQAPVQVPCEDIGILLVDHPAVTYTHAVFGALAEAGAAVVACGRGHQPEGVWLPLEANTLIGERSRAQIEAAAPLKKRIWRAIVASKLRQQARVLAATSGDDHGLEAMAGRVRSGDSDNREAAAARRYWSALFGADFQRQREGRPPNQLLNYGYAVMRSAVARAISGAGLLPVLGVHHHHRSNAFALADDLMEPYRQLVDLRVWEIVQARSVGADISKDDKAALLGLLTATVPIGGQRTMVLLATHATATSYWRALERRHPDLALPDGLPTAAESAEEPANGDERSMENGVAIRDV